MAKTKYRAKCNVKCFFLERIWEPGEVYSGYKEPPIYFDITFPESAVKARKEKIAELRKNKKYVSYSETDLLVKSYAEKNVSGEDMEPDYYEDDDGMMADDDTRSGQQSSDVSKRPANK